MVPPVSLFLHRTVSREEGAEVELVKQKNDRCLRNSFEVNLSRGFWRNRNLGEAGKTLSPRKYFEVHV